MPLPDFDQVRRAGERLIGLAHQTPVLTSATADARAGARLYFKCENFQRTGSFKFRGAANAIACLAPETRRRGVIAFSSGNHAQAVARAAAIAGIPVCIVMPSDAPAAKTAATRGYGAEIVHYDRYTEDREAIAREIAAARGMALIPPFDHADVIAGQGTAAMELFGAVGELDRLFVPVGGGGLLAGSLLSAAALSPGCAVYGVEPEAGDDVRQSLHRGMRVKIPVPRSIADGALTTLVGEIPFAIMQRHRPGILTASDDSLLNAMRFFAERMKMVVEPTGCLGAAACFASPGHGTVSRIGIILSGGNTALLTQNLQESFK
jgi:threonine dehydratase